MRFEVYCMTELQKVLYDYAWEYQLSLIHI